MSAISKRRIKEKLNKEIRQVQLKVEERKKGSSLKKLRREAKVPAVFYGKGEKNLNLTLYMAELEKYLNLGEVIFYYFYWKKEKKWVIIKEKECQRDSVNDLLLHVDLFKIGSTITVDVPLVYEGDREAKGIIMGGVLQRLKEKVTVKSTPKNMPARIIVDVRKMKLGQSLRIRDIKQSNYSIQHATMLPIVSIIIPRALRSQENKKEEKTA